MANQDLAHFWDNVALTDDELLAIKSLRHVFGSDIDSVAVIGNDATRSMPGFLSRSRRNGRRAMVRLGPYDRPVPLRSLGDGALRMFGIALALANSRDGFLLLDEAENGIHYSVQQDFWRMIFQTALDNNVQMLATTHSWDCVRGFALAAMENKKVEGLFYRLEKQTEGIRVIDYSEDDLRIVAEQGIEVR